MVPHSHLPSIRVPAAWDHAPTIAVVTRSAPVGAVRGELPVGRPVKHPCAMTTPGTSLANACRDVPLPQAAIPGQVVPNIPHASALRWV
jgi:hypothetical protein